METRGRYRSTKYVYRVYLDSKLSNSSKNKSKPRTGLNQFGVILRCAVGADVDAKDAAHHGCDDETGVVDPLFECEEGVVAEILEDEDDEKVENSSSSSKNQALFFSFAARDESADEKR